MDRVLKINLDEVIRLFETTKWKFYEVDPIDDSIRIEVPRSEFTFVIELDNYEGLAKELRREGFIEQEIRPSRVF